MKTKDHLQVYTGSAHPRLAADIARYLDVPLGDLSAGRFPDGEINVKVNHDVRGADVYLVQPTCPPVNENLMELLIMIDCMRRASAERITAVVPYFGYARKDRKDEGRVPITAKLVANLITTAGAHRVLTVDLHAAQIQGFFDIPVDHLFAAPVLSNAIKEERIPDLVVVAPDVGGIKVARAYAKRFGSGLAIVDKRRVSGEVAEVFHVIGEVAGKNVLLVDDMISTAGTIVEAVKILKDHGARQIFVAATHPVFCSPALERLRAAPIEKVIVTDTIPARPEAKVEVRSIAPLLGEAIRRIHGSESVSSLFA